MNQSELIEFIKERIEVEAEVINHLGSNTHELCRSAGYIQGMKDLLLFIETGIKPPDKKK